MYKLNFFACGPIAVAVLALKLFWLHHGMHAEAGAHQGSAYSPNSIYLFYTQAMQHAKLTVY